MVQLWRAFGHLVPLFLIIVLVICIITYVVSGKRKLDFKRVVVNLLFGLSIIGILLVTVYPEDFGHGMQRVVNLIPFVGMYNILFHSVDITVPIRNLGLNILLFVPFGFFLTSKTSSFQKKLNLFVILTGFVFSLFIETVQLAIPMGRASDIDDVILNTIGTFLGYMIWKLLNSKSSGSCQEEGHKGGRPPLTQSQKNQIIKLFEAGERANDIAKRVWNWTKYSL